MLFIMEKCTVDEFTGRLMFGRRYSEGLHKPLKQQAGGYEENPRLCNYNFAKLFQNVSEVMV